MVQSLKKVSEQICIPIDIKLVSKKLFFQGHEYYLETVDSQNNYGKYVIPELYKSN